MNTKWKINSHFLLYSIKILKLPYNVLHLAYMTWFVITFLSGNFEVFELVNPEFFKVTPSPTAPFSPFGGNVNLCNGANGNQN